ncbi:unnamed protein product [Mytilus edulis]|uniref:DZIP3-like HEPN domain-containing protein n=1 Tax=Mytilus edulis TaxID=6550 RepID=A0A8S3VA15_MYTED|nr:unnamed protein product [Mytilus edulis]
MDIEDRRRYFIVGSVILEIVQPLFRTRLENDYKSRAGLILLNCCNLAPADDNAVHKLRRYKNDYLSHNTEGEITETEYKSLWTNLTSFVLQLDPNKQNDLIRIENRPLDEGLCSRYSIDLLNIHKKLNEMDTLMQEIGSDVQVCIGESKIIPYNLGQDIFYLHHEIDLKSLMNKRLIVSDVVMMDDGRLVLCLFDKHRLLICNTDGSQVDSIPVEGRPCYVTAVNNSTVAVTVDKPLKCHCIEMYDINNKHKLKSISVPGMNSDCGITMINNKLVVGGDDRLLIVDHQTGETIQTIQTDCTPRGIHASGDGIFFVNLSIYNSDHNLYWYSFTDDNIHTLTLPSKPFSITTLQDGSLYVLCKDRSVQHVSSNGKQFKTLNRSQSLFLNDCSWIQYMQYIQNREK